MGGNYQLLMLILFHDRQRYILVYVLYNIYVMVYKLLAIM